MYSLWWLIPIMILGRVLSLIILVDILESIYFVGKIKINWVNKLLCKHSWEYHGFSYKKCVKCDKVKHSPNDNRLTGFFD